MSTGFGETIGRYHLHSQIAKGGMARIHIARAVGAEGFSRLVAAKRLHPALAGDRDFVQMFLDEARVASKVRHRNVVPVLDVVNLDGEVILVQELVLGVPLHTLCGRAQKDGTWLPIPISVAIATQALAGLHAAHEATDEAGTSLNIIHRDVSPQNVMIAADGNARLLDFGVAKTAAAAHVTRAGTFKGKLVYSAPEQLRGNASRQTDIYALGVLLWELLVGKRLHAGRTEEEIRKAILQTTPPPITQAAAKRRAAGKYDDAAWAQLEALEPILLRACAYDPAKRYQTAADMERDLCAAVTPATLSEMSAWVRQLAGDLLDETDRLIADEEASWRSAQGSDAANRSTSGSMDAVNDSVIETDANVAVATKPWPGYASPPAKRKGGLLIGFIGGAALAAAGAFFAMRTSPDEKATAASEPPTALQPPPQQEPPPPPRETVTTRTAPPPAEPPPVVQPAPEPQPAAAIAPAVDTSSETPSKADNSDKGDHDDKGDKTDKAGKRSEMTVKQESKAKPTKRTPPPPKKIATKATPTKTAQTKPAPTKPAPTTTAKPAATTPPPTTTSTKPADCSTPFYYEGNKKIFKKKCL